MERLVEMLLSGQIPTPMLNPDLLALDQELSKTELLALLMLYRRGEATMSELAADLGVPLSTATGIGARLARKGLIERERPPQDRRAILNRLTQEGKAMAVRVQTHIDTLLQQIAAALSPDELATLVYLVQKVLRSLGDGAVSAPSAPDPAETGRQTRKGEEPKPAARRIPLD